MNYNVKTSFIQVLGKIWMPNIECAMDFNLRQYDIDNIINEDTKTIDREDIENWLSSNAGDFSSIIDFRADIELPNGKNIVIEWENEENELTYNDCMYSESE